MNIGQMKAEYFRLLKRWQGADIEPRTTEAGLAKLLARLDELYQALHSAGEKVPGGEAA